MIPKNFNESINSGLLPYLLEEGGYDFLVTTRATKINAIIKDFKNIVRQGKNPNDYIATILAKHGLTEDMLTERECEKIMGCVNGLY